MHLYEAHPRKDKRDFDLIAFSINQPTWSRRTSTRASSKGR